MILSLVAGLLTGCGSTKEKEQAETISVYLWTTAMYEKYAPYIQSQLPDVNVQFVVGNNDLDFYRFMNENGELPDIITCCRFSLHDAAPLKDSLMDLSTTSEAGAIYDSYLTSFMNEDGTINWLPMCADVHGFITNKALFDAYNIPLPTDYESFVSACQAFEEAGIRGYVGDYFYDYTCMETLQGLSIPELISPEGSEWRTAYSDPVSTEQVGLDDTVWPGIFERMEQFIEDTNLTPDVLELDYNPVIQMFANREAAMISGSSARVLEFQNQGIDTVLANGQDVLTYSQDAGIHLTEHLSNIKPLIEQNRMYIRIASNDFFAVSKDVVSKMIAGEYDAKQAYEAFDAQLREPEDTSADIVLTSEKAYSNIFYSRGGNESYSVMANTLRNCYGSDVLLATGNSFTGSVFQARYTEKMTGCMIMPNSLLSFKREMTGAELRETVKAYVEGIEGGFTPFNRGSLPVVSGITIEVQENEGAYTLSKITKDGKPLQDEDTFIVTCLATGAHFAPFLADESRVFEQGESPVKVEWTQFVTEGGAVLAEPENYITLK